jgi:hypothetical protein
MLLMCGLGVHESGDVTLHGHLPILQALALPNVEHGHALDALDQVAGWATHASPPLTRIPTCSSMPCGRPAATDSSSTRPAALSTSAPN